MNQQALSVFHASAASRHQQRVAHRRTEWARKAILGGCIMTLIGMVTYCYGSFGGGPEADLPSSLFKNGALGWGAFLFMLGGVGVWLVGNIALLDEIDRVNTKKKRPKSWQS